VDEHDPMREALQVAGSNQCLEMRVLHAAEKRQCAHDLSIGLNHAAIST
jgi:hypothetical protein